MAQIDFTNAVLDVYNNTHAMTYGKNMQLYNTTNNYLDDSNGDSISTPSVSKILDTPTKVSILYTGAMRSNKSGTSFILRIGNTRVWQVSNISFVGDDTYAFIIDIEVSGNS